MSNRIHYTLLRFLLVLSLLAVVGLAQPASKGPISKKGLLEALRIGGLTTGELVQLVEQRGVDFQIGSEEERELRAAGAQPELINAIRKSYHGAPRTGPNAAAAGPLAKNEILTLLQVGTPSARVEQLVAARGVNFSATPEIAREIETAGGSAALIALINQKSGAPAPAAVPAGPAISSLRDIHKIFIEKMEYDLDQYLRAEITKQLGGRMVVVLTKEEADAVMTGASANKTGTGAAITGRYLGLHDNATGAISITDRAGTVVVWSSEAGDRSLFWGSVKRGGPRKVADRLIHKLKNAMDGK